jgi:hypothetical protein
MRKAKNTAFKSGLFSELMDKEGKEWSKSEQKGVIGSLKNADETERSYDSVKYEELCKEISILERDPDIQAMNESAEIQYSDNLSDESIGRKRKIDYYQSLLDGKRELEEKIRMGEK